MITYPYIITEELGIHARPAALIARKANSFSCDILIGKDKQMVNAKDVMAIMGLILRTGDEMVLTFDGIDEEQACLVIKDLLQTYV